MKFWESCFSDSTGLKKKVQLRTKLKQAPTPVTKANTLLAHRFPTGLLVQTVASPAARPRFASSQVRRPKGAL